MRFPRGPEASVAGFLAASFMLFLALSFDWSWWLLLVVEVALLMYFFGLCRVGSSGELGWECVGPFLIVAVLGFLFERTSFLRALSGFEVFVAEHVSVVQAVSALVVALFTAALWLVSKEQARLAGLLVTRESIPAGALSEVHLYEVSRLVGVKGTGMGVKNDIDSSEIEIKLKYSNISRYSIIIKEIILYINTENETHTPIKLFPELVIINHGESKEVVAKSTQDYKEVYRFFRTLESCLAGDNRLGKAWGCVRLVIKVAYGGTPEEDAWMCYILQNRYNNNKKEYVLVSFRTKCGEDRAAAASGAKDLW